MTTIAASVKDGLMVCDSRVQIDGMWWQGEKVTRIGKALVGGAGDSGAVKRFATWFSGSRLSKPKLGDNFNALVLDESGLWYWSSTLIAEKIDRGVHAIGSGGNAALGAMLAGASVQDAVAIACQIDTFSGGDIKTHKLKEKV